MKVRNFQAQQEILAGDIRSENQGQSSIASLRLSVAYVYLPVPEPMYFLRPLLWASIYTLPASQQNTIEFDHNK